jgi:peptidoglycan/xylan/chitin deacetylase (PgdA/CDA1 family)
MYVYCTENNLMNRINIYILILLLLLSGCSGSEMLPEQEGRIIILMYHRIVEGAAETLYDRSATDFEKDIKYLNDNNIKVIGFKDLERITETGRMPSGNCAILTFDDGDVSWYNILRPILLKHELEATLFLWTSNIGTKTYLNWSQVEYMSRYLYPDGRRPFTFESHTFTHPYLQLVKDSYANSAEYEGYLDYELGESKRIIESHTLLPVTVLALPFGDGAGDSGIIAASERNGYKMIRTSRRGTIENSGTDLYNIPSLPILDNTNTDQIGLYLNILF